MALKVSICGRAREYECINAGLSSVHIRNVCECSVCVCVCVWVHWWLSGIHSELPIERLVVQGPASGNLVLSFSLSSSGCSDHLAPPHQFTQL